jgi:hypothetical protein
MSRSRWAFSGARAAVCLLLIGCVTAPRESILAGPEAPIAPLGSAPLDTTPKTDLRMVPPEVYLRTYLRLFGGLAPTDAQKAARGAQGGALFDSWDDYVSALGFPDYRLDIPRQAQTNAFMIATFERLGVALCDRAVEHDLRARPPLPVEQRLLFAFDLPPGIVDRAAFDPRFDVLHRTFLGYPAALAPSERVPRFFQLFREISSLHPQASPKSKFTSAEAGWAAVCYGLVRHPEFQLY